METSGAARKEGYTGYGLGVAEGLSVCRSCMARAGLERFQIPLSQARLHCSQSGGMDSNGTCAKVAALLQFDASRGDTWRALQRWTGVNASQITRSDWQAPELPRRLRYCRDDPERDAQIARDVASMPHRPPPAPGPRSTKHGRNSGKAIRNAPLSRSEATMDPIPSKQ